MTPLQTIPDAEPGARFGASIVPMGDLNSDGYLDLAVGAPDRNGGAGGAYLLRSNGAPGSDLSCNPPDPGGGGVVAVVVAAVAVAAGGGPAARSRGQGAKVQSLARRKVSLRASRSTSKTSQILQLLGAVRASKNKRSCQVKQTVAIQRRNPDGSWPTVDAAVTKKNGSSYRNNVRRLPRHTSSGLAEADEEVRGRFLQPAKVKVSG